jgi:hypothetical protein
MASQAFIRPKNRCFFFPAPLAPRVQTAFEKYFGEPDAVVSTNVLHWVENAPVSKPYMSRVAVVRHVLQVVIDVYHSKEPIWFYMGKSFVSGMNPHSRNPTEIHLSNDFFAQRRAGGGSRASVLIHEMTHAWACTMDHGYSETECTTMARRNPAVALMNAESYALFLEEAFRGWLPETANSPECELGTVCAGFQN